MKNTGLTITIIVSVLALLGGSYFMMWKKDETKIPTENTESTPETPKDDSTVENKVTPTSPEPKKDTGTNVDIDAELKNLDAEMGTAWEKDSDSDPTLEIQ